MESQNALRFRPKTVKKFPAGPPLHKVLPFASGCTVLRLEQTIEHERTLHSDDKIVLL